MVAMVAMVLLVAAVVVGVGLLLGTLLAKVVRVVTLLPSSSHGDSMLDFSHLQSARTSFWSVLNTEVQPVGGFNQKAQYQRPRGAVMAFVTMVGSGGPGGVASSTHGGGGGGSGSITHALLPLIFFPASLEAVLVATTVPSAAASSRGASVLAVSGAPSSPIASEVVCFASNGGRGGSNASGSGGSAAGKTSMALSAGGLMRSMAGVGGNYQAQPPVDVSRSFTGFIQGGCDGGAAATAPGLSGSAGAGRTSLAGWPALPGGAGGITGGSDAPLHHYQQVNDSPFCDGGTGGGGCDDGVGGTGGTSFGIGAGGGGGGSSLSGTQGVGGLGGPSYIQILAW